MTDETELTAAVRQLVNERLRALGEQQQRAAREARPVTVYGLPQTELGAPPPWGPDDVPVSGWVDVGVTDGPIVPRHLFEGRPAPETIAYNNERDRVRLAQLSAYREAAAQDRAIRDNPTYANHAYCGVCTRGIERAHHGVAWSRVMGLPDPWGPPNSYPGGRGSDGALHTWRAAVLQDASQETRRG